MHIIQRKIRLQNFRGYCDELIEFDRNMSVIIGRNDIGKSTILEALEIFYNSEQVKMDIQDRNIASSIDDKVKITCYFEIPESAVSGNIKYTHFSH